MSDRPRDFRGGHATPPHLHAALCAALPRSGCRSTRHTLCVWPAVERRTQKYRIHCLSFWPIAPTAAKLHWLGGVGRCTLARGVAEPSQDALGTKRWRLGVRSFWVSQI